MRRVLIAGGIVGVALVWLWVWCLCRIAADTPDFDARTTRAPDDAVRSTDT